LLQTRAAAGRRKEYMNIDTVGAIKRPKLSPRYGVKGTASMPSGEYRSPTLSTLELRRLVAAMVD
jgi:hypothetical protein